MTCKKKEIKLSISRFKHVRLLNKMRYSIGEGSTVQYSTDQNITVHYTTQQHTTVERRRTFDSICKFEDF